MPSILLYLEPVLAAWQHPIPGMPGKTADSVEGIWQGLKLIQKKSHRVISQAKGSNEAANRVAISMEISYYQSLRARDKIYRIAYEWMLDHCVERELLQSFISQMSAGLIIYVHDVSSNGKIGNPDEGWAHASCWCSI